MLSAWDAPDPQFFDYALRACESAVAIDRSAYDATLVAAARAAGASVVTAGRRTAVARCGTMWSVDSGRTSVRAAWLVDATGREGGLMPAVTSRRQFTDRLVACSFRQPRDVHPDLLLLAAVRGGWWYVSQSADDEAWDWPGLTSSTAPAPEQCTLLRRIDRCFVETPSAGYTWTRNNSRS